VWNGYKYITWNGSIGALKDGIIPAMQGFFIKSNATGGSITIPAGSRMHSSRPYYKSVEAVSDWLSMKIESMTDTSHFDEAFVHVLGGSTPGFDSSQDAWKLAGSLDYPQIYTMAPDQSILSINTQPEYTSVPIAVQTPVAGSYKITFGGIGSFNGSQPLFFEDKASQSVINLRNNGSYVFASSGGLETGNFILHFEETGIREHAGNGFLAWSSGSVIHVDARAQGLNIEQLEIYNLTGRIVCTINNPLLPVVIPQTNMPTGLYLIKVKTREGVYTQKLLVK
jgi:hypothetical protein